MDNDDVQEIITEHLWKQVYETSQGANTRTVALNYAFESAQTSL